MDELEQVIGRAEQFDKEQQAAGDYSQSEPERVEVAAIDPIEAAGNMAETALRLIEGGLKMFADSRLNFGDEEIASGRASLAPVIDKYGLVGSGDGHIPFWQEITAGLYIGGLWRRVLRVIKALKEKDKAEAKAREAASGGEERKHEPEKQSRVVSGAIGARQEPDVDQGGRHPQSGGEGHPLGF